jgi:hypothetical protein
MNIGPLRVRQKQFSDFLVIFAHAYMEGRHSIVGAGLSVGVGARLEQEKGHVASLPTPVASHMETGSTVVVGCVKVGAFRQKTGNSVHTCIAGSDIAKEGRVSMAVPRVGAGPLFEQVKYNVFNGIMIFTKTATSYMESGIAVAVGVHVGPAFQKKSKHRVHAFVIEFTPFDDKGKERRPSLTVACVGICSGLE